MPGKTSLKTKERAMMTCTPLFFHLKILVGFTLRSVVIFSLTFPVLLLLSSLLLQYYLYILSTNFPFDMVLGKNLQYRSQGF